MARIDSRNNIKFKRWMNIEGIRYCIFVLFLSCLCACQNEYVEKSENELVSITFTTASIIENIAMRGVSDDFKNENNTWSTWDKLVDGNILYRVSLLLVDANNRLAGIKDFDTEIRTGLPNSVTTTFTKLLPNTTYTLYAVANYSAIEIDEHSWSGLPEFPDMTSHKVGDDITSVIQALNAYKLPVTDIDNVPAKQPQVLSLVQNITTPAMGEKTVSGELIRTYARLRVEVRNQSDSYDLNINSVEFGSSSSYFGHNMESLMKVTDENIPIATGNIDETSSDALTNFAYSKDNPLVIGHTKSGTLANSRVVFDSYLYEFQNENGFSYKLNLNYPNATISVNRAYYEVGSGTNNNIDTGYYMIGYGSNKYYFIADDEKLGVYQMNSVSQLDPQQHSPVIWYITKENNSYTIFSVYAEKYIKVSNNSVSLQNDESYLSISETGTIKGNRYIYIENNTIITQRFNATQFTFYPLTYKEVPENQSVAKEFEIPLETVSEGASSVTRFIRRNDFINVLVTVAYNDNAGTIDFVVKNWNSDKGGNVEFN